jgi:exonuclease SbcD
MRILHTADWHIGKSLAGFDLLDVQRRSFAQLRQIAHDKKVDAMIIAGDVYDRALASEPVVATVNTMLRTLNLEDQLPLLMIAGNHDSAARLATGREWYADTQLHLNTQLAEAFKPVVLGDTQFFLLPYFEPREAQAYFDDDSLTNVESAMRAVVTRMRTEFAADKHHVLVAHFFAAGSTHSESETKVNVGGLDAVPLDLLADFDYVALGHLHNRMACVDDTVQYAGALLKYDVGEAAQKKGCYILDTESMKREFIEIPQQPDFQHITASFADIMNGTVPGLDAANYVHFTLTDTEIIPDLMNRLRSKYPLCVGVDRKMRVQLKRAVREFNEKLDPLSLLSKFYEDALGTEIGPAEKQWAERSLSELQREE